MMGNSLAAFPNELLLKTLRHLPIENLGNLYKVAPSLRPLLDNILFENVVIVIRDSDKWNPFRLKINGFTFSYDFSNSRNCCLVFLSDLDSLTALAKSNNCASANIIRYVKSVTLKCNDYLSSHLLTADHVELFCISTLNHTNYLSKITSFIESLPNLQLFENYCPYIELPVININAKSFKIHTKAHSQAQFNENTTESLYLRYYKPTTTGALESLAGSLLTSFNGNLRDITIESGVDVLDGTCLARFPNLTSLSIIKTCLYQCKNLNFHYFPNLKTLNLSDNYIEAFDEPINLPQLRNLDLHGNNIRNVTKTAFGQLRNLEVLDLSKNKIEDEGLVGLEQLINLKVLNLAHNFIEDLFEMKNAEHNEFLHHLQVLDLSLNKLTSIRKFSQSIFCSKALTDLNLRGNQITTIEGLEFLTNLKCLNLSNNLITKLSANIAFLTSLETLSLEFNNITKLENVTGLINLKNLNMSNNNIKDIDLNLQTARKLAKLYQLNLNQNQVANADMLWHLPSLKICYLYHNKITGQIFDETLGRFVYSSV